MSRPTVKDIAKTASVSLATVDRVLNERPGVSKKTIDKVLKVIDEIGYTRDIYAANLARKREYRIAFVLAETESQFSSVVAKEVTDSIALASIDRVAIELIKAPDEDLHKLAALLNSLKEKNYDGIAVMAPETPLVRDAVKGLVDAGISVVSLVSDLPDSGRAHFVGIDNISAGRIAGFLMSRFLGREGGNVLVTTSSMQLRDSVERRLGFDALIFDKKSPVVTLPTIEGHNNKETLKAAIRRAMEKHRDIRGVYSVGPGVSALVEVLEEMSVGEDVFVIAHDLTPHTTAGLESETIDAVIAQSVSHAIRSAIRVLKGLSDGTPIDEALERIRIDIVLKENLYT